MDIIDKIDLVIDEGDSNAEMAVADKAMTKGKTGRFSFGTRKKKGTGDSEDEAPKG